MIRLKDVARIELGAQSYDLDGAVQGKTHGPARDVSGAGV